MKLILLVMACFFVGKFAGAQASDAYCNANPYASSCSTSDAYCTANPYASSCSTSDAYCNANPYASSCSH